MARMVGPAGKVYAFEPQNRVFSLLAANMALNGIDHVECIRAALGALDGEVMIGDLPADRPANYGGASLKDLKGTVRTPVYALDSFLGDVPHVELIKIDVEGMELDVLKGARELIAKHRPAIYAENNQPEKSAELVGLAREMGYRVYWHLPSHFRATNFYSNPQPMMANAIFEPSPGSEHLDSIGIAINILCLRPEINVQGAREVTDNDEHPLKRKYSASFISP